MTNILLATYLLLRKKHGDTMTGHLSMGGQNINNLADLNKKQDAATKIYMNIQENLRVAKSGDAMSGPLAMGRSRITGLTIWMVRATYGWPSLGAS